MSNPSVHVVLITVPDDEEQAVALARALVEERLVACVNMLPGVRSLYRWQGKVVDDKERLLVCKTTPERLPQLVRRVKELHTYTVPEVLALPVDSGLPDYLRWVADETAKSVF